MGKKAVKALGSEESTFHQVDVSSTDSIAKAVDDVISWVQQTKHELGGIITAAGVANPAKIIDKNGEPFDIDAFDFVMKINVRGSIDLTRQLLPSLIKVEPTEDGERGVVILVSSSAAFDGQPGYVQLLTVKQIPKSV